jgi:hypothetical protein
MEVADLDGPWQLELLMPEKRMGYILKHLEKLPEGTPLLVEFVPSTAPDTRHYGTVSVIHDRAEVRTEASGAGGATSAMNTVAIWVALDDQKSVDLRFGTEVGAKIDCGKRSLGYVIFYEAVVYVQKNILFRWF